VKAAARREHAVQIGKFDGFDPKVRRAASLMLLLQDLKGSSKPESPTRASSSIPSSSRQPVAHVQTSVAKEKAPSKKKSKAGKKDKDKGDKRGKDGNNGNNGKKNKKDEKR
jgi:hypothetical protein